MNNNFLNTNLSQNSTDNFANDQSVCFNTNNQQVCFTVTNLDQSPLSTQLSRSALTGIGIASGLGLAGLGALGAGALYLIRQNNQNTTNSQIESAINY